MYNSVQIAAISLKPIAWDKVGNADKLEAFVTAAAKYRPQVIVAPEGILEGYVVNDVLHEPSRAEAMLAIAEPLDGPYVSRFQRLAKTLNTCLCFGFAERIDHEIFNCAIFIGNDGDICGRHHKTMFREGDHPSRTFNRMGTRLRAFETPIGRAGILICQERWYPMIAHTLVLDGARVLFIPTYGDKSRAQNHTVLARGRQNGVPIVQANVGLNLIVSRGEVEAYKWGNDQITIAQIEIAQAPSIQAARQLEEDFLTWRDMEMRRRYEQSDALADIPDQVLADLCTEEFHRWQGQGRNTRTSTGKASGKTGGEGSPGPV